MKWLDTYMQFTEESESPDSYHIWSAISGVAACLERKVWFDMGYFKVYPNMFIVLVGQPGTRKTSAIAIMSKLLEEIPTIKISSDSVTRRALISSLNNAKSAIPLPDGRIVTHSSMTVISDEFCVFLSLDTKEIMKLLTTFYDCKSLWEYRTYGQGTDTIEGVWLNILAASASDILVDSLPPVAIGGGFTSRIIFIVEYSPRKKVAIPRISSGMKSLKEEILQNMMRINNMVGEFHMSDSARRWYVEWYESKTEIVAKDARFAGYADRKHIHLIKIAMCLSSAESSSYIIEVNHLQEGLKLLEIAEDTMPDAFGAIGRNILAQDIDAVLHFVTANKRISKKDLLSNLWRDINPKDVDIVLKTLQDMGLIRVISLNGVITYEYIKEEK